jgi:GT2 family glycosyltransferase
LNSGQFDRAARLWKVERTLWFRPGITNRAESTTLSAFGKPIASRVGNAFESRPNYDADGREKSMTIFGDFLNGQFDLLVRRGDAEAAGLLDERYFMYEEDVDFCAAIRRRGRRILFTPVVEVVHLRGRSGAGAPAAARGFQPFSPREIAETASDL